ncbi:MmcQ/YjbR family DNA-binding protein [Crenobacter cavernae]|uniref:MmcQ/YjbR family DNA-binding protein n=1 Tax=Crenobacter cavernae TaxID=2290923 RepID=A0A345YAA7_9NEIS|nr:MmcQ/YjbR family DNA-binding protein [Crenobacter cavernae]
MAEHAAALPGATADIKWGDNLVFSVGDRMFALFRPIGAPDSLWCKVDPARFLELTDIPGVRPAPYLARASWICIDSPAALPPETLAELLLDAHRLVAAKLSKKRRQALGLP